MKSKDLNTFINNKLNQGNGLRYEEEYWNDMSNLLDANMPVVKPESAATQPAVKAATVGVKWAVISSACAAVVTATVIYFNPFEKQQAVSPQTTKKTTVIPQTTSDIPSGMQSIPAEKSDIIQYNVPDNTPPGDQLPQAKTTKNKENADPVSPTTLNTRAIPFNAQTQSETTIITEGPEAKVQLAETYIAGIAAQHVSGKNMEFILIDPMTKSITANPQKIDDTKLLTPAYPKRNRLIPHIAVSPFVGYVFERGEQSYQSGNISYTHPAQSNFTYGINVECATKRFALRTGIGWSSTNLQAAGTYGENLYDVDTHYVILNPHYGTTRSGKPIALIQRQIDSSYVSTQYTITNENTTFEYLSIPLTLQYKIAHKRFFLVLEGGGIHQIKLSESNNISQETPLENRAELPVYNFQLTAGSSVRYAISSQWAVGVQYNYNLNPSGANLHFLNNAHVGTVMITHTIR